MDYNNNNIKISTIIPIFNAEKYLDDCLKSIINQSLKEIEIICVNDGSTDNSLEILNYYSNLDNRIKIINTDNHGQGSARNTALKEAKGEFISFVDADDWIELNSYELLYDIAKKDKLDLLFFKMINYINSSNKLIKTDLYDYKCIKDNFDDGEIFSNIDINDFLFNIAVCPVSKLYNRNFLLKYNHVFPEGIIFEDNIFFYNVILDAKRISFLDKYLYYRRRHNESVTQNITKQSFDIITVTNKILNIFMYRDLYDMYKNKLINHTFSMILEWFFKSPLKYRGSFFLKIKQDFMGFKELKFDYINNLDSNHKLIHHLFIINNDYLDFISQYNLSSVNYSKIIDSKNLNYKVSVVIPIYNNETIIHRTLMSILNQSFGRDNIEIILVNDNSTDNTSKVIDNYAYKYNNIKVIHLESNTGSSGTPRNIGLLEASANYIMFLDHDDFFEINAIEKLYNEIIAKDCDVVFGTYAVVSNGNLTKISYPNEKQGYFNNLSENERLVSFPPPSIWTKLFKKDFILNHNILFSPFLGEDAIFMTKVLINAKGISYLGNLLVCFHALDNKSLTNNVSLNYLMEGLFSEKYLLNLYLSIGKEYFFKYRCEGNLDFFLTQFLRSNLNMDEFNNFYDELHLFIIKCNSYSLIPKDENNKYLFEHILINDINAIINFKNEVGVPISDFSSFENNKMIDKFFDWIKINSNKFLSLIKYRR